MFHWLKNKIDKKITDTVTFSEHPKKTDTKAIDETEKQTIHNITSLLDKFNFSIIPEYNSQILRLKKYTIHTDAELSALIILDTIARNWIELESWCDLHLIHTKTSLPSIEKIHKYKIDTGEISDEFYSKFQGNVQIILFPQPTSANTVNKILDSHIGFLPPYPIAKNKLLIQESKEYLRAALEEEKNIVDLIINNLHQEDIENNLKMQDKCLQILKLIEKELNKNKSINNLKGCIESRHQLSKILDFTADLRSQ